MTIVEYWARIRCSRNKAFSVGGNDRRSLVTWSYTFWQESYLLQSQTVVVGTDRYSWHVRFIWWKKVPPSEERCVSGICATDQAFRRSWTDRGRGPINGDSVFTERLTILPVLTFGISPYTLYERRHIRFYHEYQMTNGLRNLVQVEFSFEGWCRGYSNHLLVCSTNVCRPICLLLTKVLLLISYPINPNSAHLIVTWIPNPYLCFQALVSFS